MGYFSALAGSGRTASRRIPIDPIVSQLRKALQDLSGSPSLLSTPSDEQVLDHLSGHFDPAHAVLLRGLLDTGDLPALDARPDFARTIRTRFDALRSDVRDRLRTIQSDLPHRFSAGTLGERLRETGWYRQSATGAWETTGRGSRKELRAVFLLAYHDLSAELERVLVQCQSRCDHLDDLVSRQCLELEGCGNGARIAMCLAEGLRPGESERRKAWRIRMSSEAEARFCAALAGRWEKRAAPELAALHQIAAEPWANPRGDGFIGFATRFLHLADVMAETMIWFSTSRWNTILSGLPMSGSLSSTPALAAENIENGDAKPENSARTP